MDTEQHVEKSKCGFAPMAADMLAAEIIGGSVTPGSSKLARAACNVAVSAVVAELRRRGPVQHLSSASKEVPAPALVAESTLDGAIGETLGSVLVDKNRAASEYASGATESSHVEYHWPGGCYTPSQAVAVQLRCMERAREEAAAEVTRVQTLERQTVRMEEEIRGRKEVRRRKEELEKAHREHELALVAKESAALERLRTKEDDAKQRMTRMREDLSLQAEELVLQRRSDIQQVTAEKKELEAAWDAIRQKECQMTEVAEKAESEQRCVLEELAYRIQREQDAERGARLAAVEGQAELSARFAEHQADVATLAYERERVFDTAKRLEESDYALQCLRVELAHERETNSIKEKELRDIKARLEVALEDLRKSRMDTERAELALEEMKRQASSLDDVLESVRSELIQQTLAHRDAEELSRVRAEQAEQECRRVRGELKSLRANQKENRMDLEKIEMKLRDKLDAAWKSERERLLTYINELHQARQQDTCELLTTRRMLQEQREETANVDASWWRWMEEVRDQYPSTLGRWRPSLSQMQEGPSAHSVARPSKAVFTSEFASASSSVAAREGNTPHCTGQGTSSNETDIMDIKQNRNPQTLPSFECLHPSRASDVPGQRTGASESHRDTVLLETLLAPTIPNVAQRSEIVFPGVAFMEDTFSEEVRDSQEIDNSGHGVEGPFQKVGSRQWESAFPRPIRIHENMSKNAKAKAQRANASLGLDVVDSNRTVSNDAANIDLHLPAQMDSFAGARRPDSAPPYSVESCFHMEKILEASDPVHLDSVQDASVRVPCLDRNVEQEPVKPKCVEGDTSRDVSLARHHQDIETMDLAKNRLSFEVSHAKLSPGAAVIVADLNLEKMFQSSDSIMLEHGEETETTCKDSNALVVAKVEKGWEAPLINVEATFHSTEAVILNGRSDIETYASVDGTPHNTIGVASESNLEKMYQSSDSIQLEHVETIGTEANARGLAEVGKGREASVMQVEAEARFHSMKADTLNVVRHGASDSVSDITVESRLSLDKMFQSLDPIELEATKSETVFQSTAPDIRNDLPCPVVGGDARPTIGSHDSIINIDSMSEISAARDNANEDVEAFVGSRFEGVDEVQEVTQESETPSTPRHPVKNDPVGMDMFEVESAVSIETPISDSEKIDAVRELRLDSDISNSLPISADVAGKDCVDTVERNSPTSTKNTFPASFSESKNAMQEASEDNEEQNQEQLSVNEANRESSAIEKFDSGVMMIESASQSSASVRSDFIPEIRTQKESRQSVLPFGVGSPEIAASTDIPSHGRTERVEEMGTAESMKMFESLGFEDVELPDSGEAEMSSNYSALSVNIHNEGLETLNSARNINSVFQTSGSEEDVEWIISDVDLGQSQTSGSERDSRTSSVHNAAAGQGTQFDVQSFVESDCSSASIVGQKMSIGVEQKPNAPEPAIAAALPGHQPSAAENSANCNVTSRISIGSGSSEGLDVIDFIGDHGSGSD